VLVEKVGSGEAIASLKSIVDCATSPKEPTVTQSLLCLDRFHDSMRNEIAT
jgi:hypothetical protein